MKSLPYNQHHQPREWTTTHPDPNNNIHHILHLQQKLFLLHLTRSHFSTWDNHCLAHSQCAVRHTLWLNQHYWGWGELWVECRWIRGRAKVDWDANTGEVEGRGKFVGPVKEEMRGRLRWDEERVQFPEVFNDNPSAGSFSTDIKGLPSLLNLECVLKATGDKLCVIGCRRFEVMCLNFDKYAAVTDGTPSRIKH